MKDNKRVTKFVKLEWKKLGPSSYSTEIEISPGFTVFKAKILPDTMVNMDISNDLDNHYLQWSYCTTKDKSISDAYDFGYNESYCNADKCKESAQLIFEKICSDIILSIID